MIQSVVRLFLLLGVLTGIVLPKSSAVLAELGVIRGQVLVICTSDGLQTLVLDRDGNPVEIKHESHPCLLVHATDTAKAITPLLIEPDLVPLDGMLRANVLAPNPAPGLDARPRAPPLA